jgi:hypothetical protein
MSGDRQMFQKPSWGRERLPAQRGSVDEGLRSDASVLCVSACRYPRYLRITLCCERATDWCQGQGETGSTAQMRKPMRLAPGVCSIFWTCFMCWSNVSVEHRTQAASLAHLLAVSLFCSLQQSVIAKQASWAQWPTVLPGLDLFGHRFAKS